jgi:hypothetical protein
MNVQDASNLLNLQGDITPELVKAAYRKACMLYHPDRNPSGLVMMQAINSAYELLKNYTGRVKETSSGYDAKLNDAINSVIHCTDLILEVCGNWLWISGNTKVHKDLLKASGFKWSPKKCMWYFRPEEWKSFNRGNHSIDEIRTTHGSFKIPTKSFQQINA